MSWLTDGINQFGHTTGLRKPENVLKLVTALLTGEGLPSDKRVGDAIAVAKGAIVQLEKELFQ